MPAKADVTEERVLLGRFAVSASREDVAGYAAALWGGATTEAPQAIPASFPIVWLGRDEAGTAVRNALMAHAGEKSRVPIHLSQTIAYDHPLAFDTAYWLEVSLTAPDDKGIVVLNAEILDAGGERQARLSGRLALVPLGELA